MALRKKQKGGALNTSTYNKSNKGIQNNMSKGSVNYRKGVMVNEDPNLKEGRNTNSPYLSKAKKINLGKKTVASIPTRYQIGGQLNPEPAKPGKGGSIGNSLKPAPNRPRAQRSGESDASYAKYKKSWRNGKKPVLSTAKKFQRGGFLEPGIENID